MAEITIRLRRDPDTGRTVVRVGLRPDDDLLPQEHEQVHRRLVGALFPGLDPAAAAGRVTVDRERPAREPVVG